MTFSFPRYSWLIIFLSFAVVAFLTVGWFRVSVTEMQVLIVPSDAKSAALATQTVETLSEDIKTVAFFDQLAKQYPEHAETWDRMTLTEKHAWWTGQIATERVKNSGIVKVTIAGIVASQSQELADEVVDTLRAEPKRLYGEASAVGVSVLEEPFTEIRLTNPLAWMIATASLGFLVAVMLLGIFGSMQSMMTRSAIFVPMNTVATPVDFSNIAGRYKSSKGIERPIETPSAPIDPFMAARAEVSAVVSESNTEAIKPMETARQYTNQPTTIITKPSVEPAAPIAVTQHAPGNLPFIEGDFSWEAALPGLKNVGGNAITTQENTVQEESVAPAEAVASATVAPEKPTEPTEEELKRRLNQLLRGEM